MKPIACAAQMTPEWLTDILYRNGSLTQGHVVLVAAQGSQSNAPEGPGFDSRHRMTIHYSCDATPSAPTRLYEGEHWGFHRWHQLEKAMMAFEDWKCEEFLA